MKSVNFENDERNSDNENFNTSQTGSSYQEAPSPMIRLEKSPVVKKRRLSNKPKEQLDLSLSQHLFTYNNNCSLLKEFIQK